MKMTIKVLTVLLFFLFLSKQSLSQFLEISWAITTGGTGADNLYGITTDDNGHIYFFG